MSIFKRHSICKLSLKSIWSLFVFEKVRIVWILFSSNAVGSNFFFQTPLACVRNFDRASVGSHFFFSNAVGSKFIFKHRFFKKKPFDCAIVWIQVLIAVHDLRNIWRGLLFWDFLEFICSLRSLNQIWIHKVASIDRFQKSLVQSSVDLGYI